MLRLQQVAKLVTDLGDELTFNFFLFLIFFLFMLTV